MKDLRSIHVFKKQYYSTMVPGFPYTVYVRTQVVCDAVQRYSVTTEMCAYNHTKRMKTRWHSVDELIAVGQDRRRAKREARKLLKQVYHQSITEYREKMDLKGEGQKIVPQGKF